MDYVSRNQGNKSIFTNIALRSILFYSIKCINFHDKNAEVIYKRENQV